MRIFIPAHMPALYALAAACCLASVAFAGLGVGAAAPEQDTPAQPPRGPATAPPAPAPSSSGTLSFSPRGSAILVTTGTGMPSGLPPPIETPYSGGPAMGAAASSRDGQFCAIILQGMVEVRKADNLEVVARLPMPTTPRLALAFSPDNKELLVAGAARALLRWDIAARKQTAEFPLAELPPGSIEGMNFALGADGATLGAVADGGIFCFDTATGKLLWRADGLDANGPLALSADGARLAVSVAQGKSVQTFDARTGGKVELREIGGSQVQSLALSADGGMTAALQGEGRLDIWGRRNSGQFYRSSPTGPPLYDRGALTFAPDSAYLIASLRWLAPGQHPATETIQIQGKRTESGQIGIFNKTSIKTSEMPWGAPVVFSPDGMVVHLFGPSQIESRSVAANNSPQFSPYTSTLVSVATIRTLATVTLPTRGRVVIAADGGIAFAPDTSTGIESIPITVGQNMQLSYRVECRIYLETNPKSNLFQFGGGGGGLSLMPGAGGIVDGFPMLRSIQHQTVDYSSLDPSKTYVFEVDFTLSERAIGTSIPGGGALTPPGYAGDLVKRTLRQTFVPGELASDPSVPGRTTARGRAGVPSSAPAP